MRNVKAMIAKLQGRLLIEKKMRERITSLNFLTFTSNIYYLFNLLITKNKCYFYVKIHAYPHPQPSI